MLHIQQKQVENAVVLELAGRITIGRDCQELEWRMDDLTAAGNKNLVVDMTGVTFLDSTGLGILAMCSGKLKSAGGQLRVAGAIPPVEQVFRLTKVDTILAIYPTVADALAASSGSAAGV